ncbi:spore-associated protein A [Streptomyces sp. NPDC048507]|uniref:spore-associated protein A n=1 Tax=Streptomyces sp. NPDC048507 TaxID=3365560 RepID=UPI003712B5D3
MSSRIRVSRHGALRRGATAVAAAGLALAGAAVVGAAPAQAAAAVCEGTKVDTLTFATGYTYLYYSSATGRNCAYTVPKSGSGTPQLMFVGLTRASDNVGSYQSGDFKYYAGPVYLDARGTCVQFNGQVGSWSGNSGWGHCGSLAAGAR